MGNNNSSTKEKITQDKFKKYSKILQDTNCLCTTIHNIYCQLESIADFFVLRSKTKEENNDDSFHYFNDQLTNKLTSFDRNIFDSVSFNIQNLQTEMKQETFFNTLSNKLSNINMLHLKNFTKDMQIDDTDQEKIKQVQIHLQILRNTNRDIINTINQLNLKLCNDDFSEIDI